MEIHCRQTLFLCLFMETIILHKLLPDSPLPAGECRKSHEASPAAAWVASRGSRPAASRFGQRRQERASGIRPLLHNDLVDDEGTGRLREALRGLVERSGRSVREIEREAGLGHGTLGSVLRGRSDLRVRHLELVARALGLTLRELLSRAYGLPSPEARDRRERLRALIAEVVRAELASFWERRGIRLEGAESLARVQEIEP